jgi:tetratricopeptide (TPR) repeat protein
MLAGLGAAQFANGSYADAARCLCDASDLYPADPAPYLFLGKMTKAAPDPLPCAREKLARFAKEQPGNALANYYYAAALQKDARASGNAAALVKAGALLEKAVAIDAQFADAYVLLGIVFSERGEVAPAISAYEKAITANPQSGEAHYRLGLAYKRVGEEAKARVELQLYKQINQADSLTVDRQRHELRQFMILLKEQPAPAAPH